jgi:hypothetical protein
MKYEYKVQWMDVVNMETRLNTLGEQQWEVISITANNTTTCLVVMKKVRQEVLQIL